MLRGRKTWKMNVHSKKWTSISLKTIEFLEWATFLEHSLKNFADQVIIGRAISPNLCIMTFGTPCSYCCNQYCSKVLNWREISDRLYWVSFKSTLEYNLTYSPHKCGLLLLSWGMRHVWSATVRKGLKAASCSPESCILVVSPIRLFQSFLVKMEQLIDIAQLVWT